MEILSIKATDNSPSVLFDAHRGIYQIEGTSIMENAAVFFDPLQDWIEEYAAQINPEINLVFKLKCFDSATKKYFLELLIKLEVRHKINKKTKFTWYYNKNDPDMGQEGLSLARMTEIGCNLIAYDQENKSDLLTI